MRSGDFDGGRVVSRGGRLEEITRGCLASGQARPAEDGVGGNEEAE